MVAGAGGGGAADDTAVCFATAGVDAVAAIEEVWLPATEEGFTEEGFTEEGPPAIEEAAAIAIVCCTGCLSIAKYLSMCRAAALSPHERARSSF
jgi:hypothetical protein